MFLMTEGKKQVNTEFEQLEEEDDEINLGELFFVLRRHLFVLFLSAVIGAAAAFGYTANFITPQYTSSSMIYIFSKTTTISSVADLQIGSQLTVDFEILGTSRPVLEKVISDLKLDTTYEDLLKTIKIENPTDSRIIRISVTNPDPQLACDIANSVADSLSARVAQVIDTDKPSSVENAVPASRPTSPSKAKNTAMGGIAALLLAMAVILIRYYSDMTIKDEDDVRKYLGLGTLASFPMEKSIAGAYGSKGRGAWK